MNKSKSLIVIVLLTLTLIGSYSMPVAKYTGTGFITNLKIPLSIDDWKGTDITDQLNLDFDKDWNKFISEVLIYEYAKDLKNRLVFILLDAGNFHHPNVCFTAAGYELKELGITDIKLPNRTIKAHSVFTTKGRESNLSLYWIVIEKNITEQWIEQKIKQLFFSLFNRKQVGLMVRFDVPATEHTIQEATMQARDFISALSKSLSQEHSEYLFGKN